MFFKHSLLAVFCMLPIIMSAHADCGSDRTSNIAGPLYKQVITEVTLTDLSCEFNWASVTQPDGSTINYMDDDKGCQPFQGPCVAYSYIKVMEARLNYQNGNVCRDVDFSIPWLDYAAWSPNYFDNFLNNGNGVPQENCGNFPIACDNQGREGNTCFCLRSQVLELATDQNLCFSIEKDIESENGEEVSCEDRWEVRSSPMTSNKIFARENNKIYPTSIETLKEQIMAYGPLVAIFGANSNPPVSRIYQYRSYTEDENLRFHSFVITGWEDQPNGDIVFHVDDHWPFDSGNFCGPGRTNPLSAGSILDDIGTGFLELVRVNKVELLSDCEDAVVEEEEGEVIGEEDPDPNEPETGNCFALSQPVVTDLYTTSSRKCLAAGHMNRVLATVNCGNYGINGLEMEWSVTPGGVSSPSVSGCSAQAFIVPSTNSPVSIVRARARFGPNCPWSEWYQEEFCVESKGDPDGPKLWGGE